MIGAFLSDTGMCLSQKKVERLLYNTVGETGVVVTLFTLVHKTNKIFF